MPPDILECIMELIGIQHRGDLALLMKHFSQDEEDNDKDYENNNMLYNAFCTGVRDCHGQGFSLVL